MKILDGGRLFDNDVNKSNSGLMMDLGSLRNSGIVFSG